MKKKENPVKKAVGCFLEYEGRFLIIKRALGEPQEGKWGLPAGGVEEGETEEEAVVREVREETGVSITSKQLEFLKEITVDYPGRKIDFYVYRVRLGLEPKVVMDDKHGDFAWVTGRECGRKNLIRGFREILKKTEHV